MLVGLGPVTDPVLPAPCMRSSPRRRQQRVPHRLLDRALAADVPLVRGGRAAKGGDFVVFVRGCQMELKAWQQVARGQHGDRGIGSEELGP